MSKGHVFVVHGHLEDVTCDAILLPTDTSLTISQHWLDLMGDEADALRDGVPKNGHVGDSMFWLVDVTENDRIAREPDTIRNAVSERVGQIAEWLKGRDVVRGRAQHLIALPLLGSGGGGQLKAAMVTALLDELQALTAGNLDFAIVVPDRTSFEALQRHRRPEDEDSTEGEPEDLARKLGKLARQDGLSLMIGAGVSMGAGLPSWNGLLREMARVVKDDELVALVGTRSTDQAEGVALSEEFEKLGALDQAQLLEALLGTALGQMVVASIVNKKDPERRRPALGHLLLAGLGCRQVATTNYDDLYEIAVRSQENGEITKLPYERPVNGQPWILKMHGDVEHKDDIVLTRSSFVAYDGRHRPAGSLFQSMLMTSHVLFVGVSLIDDNLLRLTHEVAHYVNDSSSKARKSASTGAGAVERNLLGTVLTLAPDPHRTRLWQDNLDWRAAGTSDAEDSENARSLEVFLDSVAMWAVPNA